MIFTVIFIKIKLNILPLGYAEEGWSDEEAASTNFAEAKTLIGTDDRWKGGG